MGHLLNSWGRTTATCCCVVEMDISWLAGVGPRQLGVFFSYILVEKEVFRCLRGPFCESVKLGSKDFLITYKAQLLQIHGSPTTTLGDDEILQPLDFTPNICAASCCHSRDLLSGIQCLVNMICSYLTFLAANMRYFNNPFPCMPALYWTQCNGSSSLTLPFAP
jgi:hypothetical protein